MPDRTQNPMHRLPDWRKILPKAQAAPRCHAHVRSGAKCRSPAMPNGCCRMHGGGSTGPRTAEGLARLRVARTIHGGRSAAAAETRAMIRGLKAETKRLVELV